jgi:hypothetical protein
VLTARRGSRSQDGPEDGRPGDEVQANRDEHDDAERDQDSRRVAVLVQPLDGHRCPGDVHHPAHREHERDQTVRVQPAQNIPPRFGRASRHLGAYSRVFVIGGDSFD